jgi:hypothetical protein
MLNERKGDLPGREEMQRTIDERIASLKAAVPALSKPGYKAWWEFWS